MSNFSKIYCQQNEQSLILTIPCDMNWIEMQLGTEAEWLKIGAWLSKHTNTVQSLGTEDQLCPSLLASWRCFCLKFNIYVVTITWEAGVERKCMCAEKAPDDQTLKWRATDDSSSSNLAAAFDTKDRLLMVTYDSILLACCFFEGGGVGYINAFNYHWSLSGINSSVFDYEEKFKCACTA